MSYRKIFLLCFIWLGMLPAHAALRVFACEPEWGALAQELGGDKVEVFVATTALQDPHQIQAKPSLIAQVRNAHLVVCTGAELEVGWLPILLQQAGNAQVQPGQIGYLAAGDLIQKIGVPKQLDRAQGDVHAAGNPHIQTDPRNISQVALALGARLQRLDPNNERYYLQRQNNFMQRWQTAISRWTIQAKPLKGEPIVSQHEAFAYLNRWLGLREVAVLEPKPGVEPSVAHLQQVMKVVRLDPAHVTLYAAYQDPSPAEWLQKNAGTVPLKLPFTVGGTNEAKDLFSLFDDTLKRLREAILK